MPRPKSPASALLTRRIVFHLTQAEFTLLAHRAATLNIKVNALARHRAMSPTEANSSTHSGRCDPALLKQLHHIGHNLNQLVKNAHIFGRISPHVERLCKRIDALMDEAIEKGTD